MRRLKLKTLLTFAVLAALLSATNLAQVATQQEQTARKLDEKTRLKAFDEIWKTIYDNFWNKTFGGVDWQAVKEKYQPQVLATPGFAEFHQLMNQMVGELKVSHMRVFPTPRAAGSLGQITEIGNGTVGLDVRWANEEWLVTGVRADFPGAAAHIRPGYILQSINGKTPALAKAELERRDQGFRLNEQLQYIRAAQVELGGKANVTVTLEVRDDLGTTRTLTLERQELPVGMSTFEFEARRMEGNIGYIRFNLFLNELLPKARVALAELHDTKGLIVDLRGNRGGIGPVLPELANELSQTAGELGAMQFRNRRQAYSYAGSGATGYAGPVVILVDELTGSTAEMLAGGLQDNRRAVVVGTTTAGAVMPSVYRPLSTGGTLQHVVANFATSKGTVLEGRGVIPDIRAVPTREALLAGRDPALERAVEVLRPKQK